MRRKLVVLFMTLIGLGAIIYGVFAVRYEMSNNAMLPEKLAAKDYQGLYRFYAQGQLDLENRTAIGDGPITLVLVVDFASPAAQAVYASQAPLLQSLYVASGQARMRHAYYLPEAEYEEEKGRFIYAAAGSCLLESGGSDLVGFHTALFGTAEEQVRETALRFNATPGPFDACVANAQTRLYPDMVETRTFRIVSPSIRIGLEDREETVLEGDPTLEQINRTVRQKQVMIGI